MSKFPKTIFVKWEKLENDVPWLLANVDMYDLVETGSKKTKIATYQLVETTEAEMVVNASTPVKAKHEE